jgi:putative endonuclease
MPPCHGGGRGFESRPVRKKGSENSEPFFMPYYVYILKSLVDGTYYKGSTEDYIKRLQEHNSGLSQYTARKVPWVLIYVEQHPDKRSALIRERKLKRCKAEYFEWLVNQPTNFLGIK